MFNLNKKNCVLASHTELSYEKNTIILKCKSIWTHYLQVKQHYYKDLFSMITRDSKAAIPVLDPTQGKQSYKKTHIGFKLPQKHNTVLQSCFYYLTEQRLTMGGKQ